MLDDFVEVHEDHAVGDRLGEFDLGLGLWLGSVVMMFGCVVALVYGVDADGKGLEEIAAPLNKADRNRAVGEAAETI
ncbi:hypothetical protein A6A40_14315 [Azospirillum humicireducens]|uniref:Uncharacterized protein n=1 Tax=Azospirillum humicireducens TaxID=1226968 RepID=A0A160JIH1_9PROT|nr:hypothetical protein A6A40_14315 [Azospirillum humicireducens]